jgi:hypothetical protein
MGVRKMTNTEINAIKGRCFCGLVRFEINGPLWMEQSGDYYAVNDGTPQMQRKWEEF